ncbi:MAG: hypothetical protein ACRD3O_05915 [Terriglobia bacterium]
MGGPIYIPGVYNGHNRSFFFFGFQGTESAGASSATYTVPIAAFRNGDFSSLGTTIYDPLTIHFNPATGQYTRSPFPGNMIPTDRTNSVATKSMSYFPLPNFGPAGSQFNNYFDAASVPSHSYQFDSRVDHTWNSKNSTYVTVSRSWGFGEAFNPYTGADAVADPNDAGSGGYGLTTSVDHVLTLSPSLIADLRLGFNRSTATRYPYSIGFNPTTELGMPQYVTTQAAKRDLQFPTFSYNTGNTTGA